MSSYDNVIGGKLKLKGKALDVEAAGVKKKKKHRKHRRDQCSEVINNELSGDGNTSLSTYDPNKEDPNDANKSGGEKNAAPYDALLTPAERRYIEQREKLDVQRLAKISNKSHRDRIEEFNQRLANMSEHYDIPKVGPG